jgi:hypothetical protein
MIKKEIVRNKEWESARYKIGLLKIGDKLFDLGMLEEHSPRFNVAPPEDVWSDPVKRNAWMLQHAIYPFKYVDVEVPD